jgi:ribonuclease PH
VALVLALRHLNRNAAGPLPLRDYVAATSVGRVGGIHVLDLNYDEDSKAEVDMNVVKTGRGRFIEIQGTAESRPFDEQELAELMRLADSGIRRLVERQAEVLGPIEFLPPT